MKKLLFIVSTLIILFIVFCLYIGKYPNSNFTKNTDTVSVVNSNIKDENKKKGCAAR